MSSAPIARTLAELHADLAGDPGGRVATYIPELSKADPRHFGIALATVDGKVYEVGDTRVPFTIQSISKALVYALALQLHGREAVERRVGTEPSGDAFNSISLEPGTGRPRNPMINAGAIAVSAMVPGATAAMRLQRVLDVLGAFAGRPLEIDRAVFESERSTGHRNRAIGHLLRSHGVIDGDPEPATDLYFAQCSALVDCRDLALMAATLANGGRHPLSGVQAVDEHHVPAILSVMTTCGMYDASGEWVYRVGLPAKSGVGGGILAVLPGQLGLGVFSPALDARGNPARGVRVCEALSRTLGLHVLQAPRPGRAGLRSRCDLAALRSKRRRPEAERRLLESHGAECRVYALQGDLGFAALEPLLRDLETGLPQDLVLDFERVGAVDAAASRLLERVVESLAEAGGRLLLAGVRRGRLADFGTTLPPRHAAAFGFVPQLDAALEEAERRLLQRHRPAAAGVRPAGVALSEHQFLAGLDADQLGLLEPALHWLEVEAGDLVVRRGDPADRLFLLLSGELSVVVDLPGGGTRRLTTLGPGMGFGELALLEGGRRTADVRADTPVRCASLDAAAFEQLQVQHPALAAQLLRNLLRQSTETVARLSAEVAALGSALR